MKRQRSNPLARSPRGITLIRIVPACAAVVACAAVASAAAGATRSSGYTIMIGNVTSLTGNFSASGPAFAKAANLAVQQANVALRKAGMKNVKVKLETVDDESTTTGAVDAARKVASDGASCILGALSSGSTIAIAQAVSIPGRIPQISPTASSPAITTLPGHQGVLFRLAPSDLIQSIVLDQVIHQQLRKGATVTLAGRNDTFGTGLLNPLKQRLQSDGFNVMGPIFYDPTQTNFDSEASQIVSKPTDGYVIIDFPQTYGLVGAALLRTGKFDASKMFTAGAWPATVPSFIPEKALDGATGTKPGALQGTKVWNAFNTLFTKTPGVTDRQPSDQNTFDAAMLCILAGVEAKSGNPQKIAAEIPNIANPRAHAPTYNYLQLVTAFRRLSRGKPMQYFGVSGPIDLDQNGDRRINRYDVFKYVNGAQQVLRQIEARQ